MQNGNKSLSSYLLANIFAFLHIGNESIAAIKLPVLADFRVGHAEKSPFMLTLFQLFMGFMVCADRDKWLNSEKLRNSNNFKMKGVNLTDVGADAALSAEGCFPAVVLMQYSSHILSWQLAIVFVAFGMAGVNKTLLENINLSCSSQISFFWSVFFCQFWGNNKAAHRENAGQRCSFLIHSYKIISRNIINMFHSSDLCVSLLRFSSESWLSF